MMNQKVFYYETIRPLVRRICYFLFEVVLRILSLLIFWVHAKPLDLGRIHKIVLIKMERVGDLVLSTPAIRAIREKFPSSRISLIINPYTKEIIEKDPGLDEVIVYDRKSALRSLRAKIHFIRDLRKRRFDLGIDLSTRDFFFLPVWLLYLSKAKLTLGLDNLGRGFLFNAKVKPYSKPRPLAEEILHILSPLGITTSDTKPKLFISAKDNSYIQRILKKESIKESDFLICIHPGGMYETQYWRKDGYSKVTQHVISKYGAKVIFVGSQEEIELADEIISSINERPLNLVGQTSLGQLMALISGCHLFIGSSSGPLHIAVGLNIPTISFLGPTIPERWSPRGEKDVVFRKDLSCSPCNSGFCYRKDLACMRDIRPGEVIEAVDRQLLSTGRQLLKRNTT